MIVKTLEKVINEFITVFQSNPTKYFYEEDLRAELINLLWNESIFNIKIPILENNIWLKDYLTLGKTEIEVSGIKSEYPSKTRFDIAYIDPKKINTNSSENHYIFDCSYAFEIKLSQQDSRHSGFKDDMQKLKKYKDEINQHFTGIAINFEQNPIYNINQVKKHYRNKFSLVDNISLVENEINCFFVAPRYVVGCLLDN